MRGRTTGPTHRRDTGAPRGRSPAVTRAYARRAQRTGARHGGLDSADAGRTPFVLLVMVLLGVALVSTLWLSTAATADSYHLQSARTQARNLAERSESLSREVATLETAPELARRAHELGMVPAGNPARLIVRPDGTVVLIGQPRRATAPAPPPAVAPAPPAAAPVPPAVAPVPPPSALPAPAIVPAQTGVLP
ncbi:MAG: septum formation initiator [Pseudonocardiaceae bacterium]